MNYKLTIIAIAVVLFIGMRCLYTNKQSMGGVDERFIVYGSMRCGYTVKMLDYLKSHNQKVKFIDVNTPEGGAAFNKLNIRGVPYTIDMQTGENISGFRKINL